MGGAERSSEATTAIILTYPNLFVIRFAHHQNRIVLLTSSTHHMAKNGLLVDDLNCLSRPYTLFGQYSQSKICNIILAKELVKRYPSLFTAAVHPGVVRTDVVRNLPPFIKALNTLFGFVMWSLQKTPVEGSYTTLHCCIVRRDRAGNGAYWANCTECKANKWADEEGVGERLWEESEKLTGGGKKQ